MRVPVPYGETVMVHRTAPDGQDDYGNDVLVETIATVTGCAVWPRQRVEADPDGQADHSSVVIGLALVVPAGVTVKATDRIMVRGDLYEVDGEPGHWLSFLTGTDAGTQVALRRAEG